MSDNNSAVGDFYEIIAALDDDDFPITGLLQRPPLMGVPYVIIPNFVPFSPEPPPAVQIGRVVGMDKRNTKPL